MPLTSSPRRSSWRAWARGAIAMSGYQYYELQAIDRPLTEKEMGELVQAAEAHAEERRRTEAEQRAKDEARRAHDGRRSRGT